MSYTILSHVATGDLATAALHNTLLDDIAIIKTWIADDGRWSGEVAKFNSDVGTLTAAANAVTLDLSVRNNFKHTLTANLSATPGIVVTNWVASKATYVTLRLTQDGSGGHTVNFPSGWKWSSGSAPTVTATLNKTDVLVLYSDDGGTTIFASLFTYNA
jgi:hypothetical protein